MYGVTTSAQVQGAFSLPPAGYTPLTRASSGILASLAPVLSEKRVLLVIATDGQPTDDAGNVRIQVRSRVGVAARGPPRLRACCCAPARIAATGG